ncbi:hypothetical protein AXG53_02450 [Stenotrophomonas sp. KCTC 12332]|nr:hypothetical protein AXG53_02450 [Stenotrophomonas sp. KCTC 12332]
MRLACIAQPQLTTTMISNTPSPNAAPRRIVYLWLATRKGDQQPPAVIMVCSIAGGAGQRAAAPALQ